MTVQYEWVIESMETIPEIEGFKNIVNVINWRVNATKNNINSTNYGTVTLDFNKEKEFISYNNLTEEIVSDWVKNALGKDEVSRIENILEYQILVLSNPKTVVLKMPWEE